MMNIITQIEIWFKVVSWRTEVQKMSWKTNNFGMDLMQLYTYKSIVKFIFEQILRYKHGQWM